jgi:ceramide synthetase
MNDMPAWQLVGAITMFFNVARYAFQYSVQQTLARYPKLLPDDKRVKFSESAWKCVYYATMSYWAFEVVMKEDFFWNTRLCWDNWPKTPMSDSFRLFYLTELAFYLHSLLAHVTIEVRRKDYWEMLVHHVVASLLIGASYYHGVFRIGGVLLALHDIDDVFLEAAKMCQYVNLMMLAHLNFGVLIVCWLVTRIILFVTKILYSSSFDVHSILGYLPPEWFFFFGLLLMIQSLNIFWFVLMVRIVFNKISTKEPMNDIREE